MGPLRDSIPGLSLAPDTSHPPHLASIAITISPTVTYTPYHSQDVDNGVALAKKLVHYMGGQASGQAQRRMAAAFKVAPTLTVEVRLLGQ